MATANVFLRRFFLSNSLIYYDPACIMTACIFLASKVEDSTIDARNLSSATESRGKRQEVDAIVAAEVAVLASQGFQLHVQHAFRPLKGLTEKLRKYSTDVGWYSKSTSPDFSKLYVAGREWLEEAAFSDLPLLYSPGQIALGALVNALADRSVDFDSVVPTEFLASLSPQSDSLNSPSDSQKNDQWITKISAVVKALQETKSGSSHNGAASVKFDEVKAINKRLKKCREWGKGGGGGTDEGGGAEGGGGVRRPAGDNVVAEESSAKRIKTE